MVCWVVGRPLLVGCQSLWGVVSRVGGLARTDRLSNLATLCLPGRHVVEPLISRVLAAGRVVAANSNLCASLADI